MKARIICNGLNDLRDKVQELCKPSEVKRVYLPENEESNNHYGIAYAVDSKNNVIAATPYWKTEIVFFIGLSLPKFFVCLTVYHIRPQSAKPIPVVFL